MREPEGIRSPHNIHSKRGLRNQQGVFMRTLLLQCDPTILSLMLCFDSNFTTYGQKQFEPGVRRQYATVITTLTPLVNTKNFLNGNKHQSICGLQIKKKKRLAFPVTEPGTNHKKRVGCRFTMEATQCCAVLQLQLSAPNKCTASKITSLYTTSI